MAALQNAASIASLLLTTECMITEIPENIGRSRHAPGRFVLPLIGIFFNASSFVLKQNYGRQ